MTTKILRVMLWGREVGRLSIDKRRAQPYFEFNREWLENGLDHLAAQRIHQDASKPSSYLWRIRKNLSAVAAFSG